MLPDDDRDPQRTVPKSLRMARTEATLGGISTRTR